jgi:endoglucanase
LRQNWQHYVARFIQPDGRVIDHGAEAISTSEGQAYALLRAVWSNDKATFDRVLRWAVDNLEVRGDHLWAWKWGKSKSDQWHPLDKTSASDADIDAAMALFIAAQRWPTQAGVYRQQAMDKLADIWRLQTQVTPLGRVLLPGDWNWASLPENTQGVVFLRLNPSYCWPLAFRLFAEEDPSHPWQELQAGCDQLVRGALKLRPDGLPPDWVLLHVPDKKLRLPPAPLDGFGYDAVRVFWRQATLASVLHQPQWLKPLKRGLAAYKKHLKHKATLPGPLALHGQSLPNTDGMAILGAMLLPLAWDRASASDMEVWLEQYARPGLADNKQDYYPQNWLWIGTASLLSHQRTQETRPSKPGQAPRTPSTLQQLDGWFHLPSRGN